MGKSPGKWIKALLGKKSSRSHVSKARDATKTTLDRDYSGRKGPAATDANSPVISDPILVDTDRSGIIQDIGKGTSFESAVTGELPLSIKQDSGKLENAGPGETNDSVNSMKEQAAVKAQAAFRGYLARRDFRALKGIIRLQAVVRGYLVRRQAVSTLCAMHGIVQFQALVRGWKVRRSGIGLEISTKYHIRKSLDVKNVVTWREKASRSAYIRKNVLPTSTTTPLRIKYNQELPNCVMSWMERWSSSCFWKPLPRPKKIAETKTQTRRSNYTMDTESGRSKRIFRKNQTSNTESGSINFVSESEKSKRVSRKVSSSHADAMQEPQSELEKVKRNLRRVSNLATGQASNHPDESEKDTCITQKITGSLSEVPDQAIEATTVEKPKDEDPAEMLKKDVSEPNNEDPAGMMKKDVPSLPETSLDVESSPKETSLEVPAEVLGDKVSAIEATLLPSLDNQASALMDEDLNSKEEQTYYENQKKRRSSFPAKAEYTENGLQDSPALPSYMAATQSAKAKLRGLNSPRFGSESTDRNSFTRRHSLPSSTNGKLSSHSPSTQRLGPANGKGSKKGDRILLSSRDGHDKPIQVEWRR